MNDIEARREHERRKAKEEGIIGSGQWWAITNSLELVSSTGASAKQLAFAAAVVIAFLLIGGYN